MIVVVDIKHLGSEITSSNSTVVASLFEIMEIDNIGSISIKAVRNS